MLRELSIKDFAIIDSLSVSFSEGFSVFTGETGAGKSIIIDAIDLVLGDRARIDTIRSGTQEAVVEALFDLSGADLVKERLAGAGLDCVDELVIRRVVNRSGRNKVYINGGLSTLITLADIAGALIDICGQSEHQSLTRSAAHIEILDTFAGLDGLRAEMAARYREMRDLEVEQGSIMKLVAEGSKERELKSFQLNEIVEAALSENEESKLAVSRERLKNSEKLSTVTGNAERILYSQEGSILEKLGVIVEELTGLSEIDERIKEPAVSLKEALYVIEDSAGFLRDYSSSDLGDADNLEEIEERLDLINNLKRKYDMGVPEILVRAEEIEKELVDIEGFDERLLEIEASLFEVRKKAEVIAGTLTKERLAASLRLKEEIEKELKDLAMEGASFEVEIKSIEPGKAEDEGVEQRAGAGRINEKGADRVSFLVSTNPGEELMPIEHVASGGELSRIMLAMKTSTSFGRVPTMIFDEIDTGVGGSMAKKIAMKLKGVAVSGQAICITHMPQIAVFADNHYFVSKGEGADGRMVTSVAELSGDEVAREITRMLGGEGEGKEISTVIRHAEELLSSARKEG
jgi:DNA repair protein RecN (Recombination protein N)